MEYLHIKVQSNLDYWGKFKERKTILGCVGSIFPFTVIVVGCACTLAKLVAYPKGGGTFVIPETVLVILLICSLLI